MLYFSFRISFTRWSKLEMIATFSLTVTTHKGQASPYVECTKDSNLTADYIYMRDWLNSAA